jgi:hypothetical protein
VFVEDYHIMMQDAQSIRSLQLPFTDCNLILTTSSSYSMIANKILDIGYKCDLDMLTCHIALKLLSIYLRCEKKAIDNELIALCILLIAAKFNQTDETLISIGELLQEATVRYFKEQILFYEIEILNTLQWSLNILTPLHFIQVFEAIGVIFKSDTFSIGSEIRLESDSRKVNKVVQKATNVLELLMKDFKFSILKEEQLAFACVLYSRKFYKIETDQNDNFEAVYNIHFKDVSDIEAQIGVYFSLSVGEVSKASENSKELSVFNLSLSDINIPVN